ncbi:MAG: iron-sulfur cluster assembly scaffold protein [Myxococcota bacterium]
MTSADRDTLVVQDGAGVAEPTTHCGSARNPLCGDRIDVTLAAEESFDQVRYNVRGCAITKASAALMAKLLEGEQTLSREEFSRKLHEAIDPDGPEQVDPRFEAFVALRKVRSRRRCATLPWEALEKSLSE